MELYLSIVFTFSYFRHQISILTFKMIFLKSTFQPQQSNETDNNPNLMFERV